MVELTFASKDDLVYVFVHAIVTKIIVAHRIFSSYLGAGQMFGVNIKFVVTCVILRLGGELVVNVF